MRPRSLRSRRLNGGESGIRTHGTSRYTRLKPLGHLSGVRSPSAKQIRIVLPDYAQVSALLEGAKDQHAAPAQARPPRRSLSLARERSRVGICDQALLSSTAGSCAPGGAAGCGGRPQLRAGLSQICVEEGTVTTSRVAEEPDGSIRCPLHAHLERRLL